MSENEQPDLSRALGEAFDAMGRALAAWFEQMRPVFEKIGEIASRPEVIAAMERHEALRDRSAPAACHCLCGKTHPDDKGICEAYGAVTTRTFTTDLLGAVDVPLCAPCAAAQGIAELAAQL